MNVYEIVTQSIIQALEIGVAPWRQPWKCGKPANFISRTPYRGLNSIVLGLIVFRPPLRLDR